MYGFWVTLLSLPFLYSRSDTESLAPIYLFIFAILARLSARWFIEVYSSLCPWLL